MEKGLKDITKICANCKKEFTITAEAQKDALEKGIEIKREYCNECLRRWRKGEVILTS